MCLNLSYRAYSCTLYRNGYLKGYRIEDLVGREGLKMHCYQAVFLLESKIILPLHQQRVWAMLTGLEIPVWVLFSKVLPVAESKEISIICISG